LRAAEKAKADAEALKKRKEEQESKAWDEQDTKYQLSRGPFTPVQRKVVAQNSRLVVNAEGFTYAFWLKPIKKHTSWTSILQKGDRRDQRNPAVFFYPNSFRLHIRSGTSQGPNPGCDPLEQPKPNQWTHVVISHAQKGGLTIFFNGRSVCSAHMLKGPETNTGHLWVADQFHDPATCFLADLRYYPKAINVEEAAKLHKARRFTDSTQPSASSVSASASSRSSKSGSEAVASLAALTHTISGHDDNEESGPHSEASAESSE